MAKAQLQAAARQAYNTAQDVLKRVYDRAVQVDALIEAGDVNADVLVLRVVHDMATWRKELASARAVGGLADLAKIEIGDSGYDMLAAVDTFIAHIDTVLAAARAAIPTDKVGGKDTPPFWYFNADGTVTQHTVPKAVAQAIRPSLAAIVADGL